MEDFDAVRWHGRIVWIVYDSDVLKPGVQWAERRLTKELESRGAVVILLRIPHRRTARSAASTTTSAIGWPSASRARMRSPS